MNVFIIPSWYPSEDRPNNGIMIYEQLRILCSYYKDINVGISIWGQQEDRYLLWIKDHFKNIKKVLYSSTCSSVTEVLPNLKEYKTPAFTWTNRIAKGNLKGIVKANLSNLRAFEADFGPAHIIHAQVGHPAGLIAMELSRKTGIPYCITERMGPFPSIFSTNKNGQLTTTYRKVYDSSIANIAISPYQEKVMQSYEIDKIHVIPNFTNELFFKPAEQKNTSRFTFFCLGRIESLKGIRELLKAMALASKKHNSFDLRIGGSGPQVEYFKNLSKKHKIEGSIVWLGDLNREETLKEFQKCNAFVLPSHYESFGTSYIEALACGKPIIATKCGGPESIVTSINGLLVEKEAPRVLANAMLNMIENYSLYDSTAIRQEFLNRFSAKAVLPQMVEFYKKIISKSLTTL